MTHEQRFTAALYKYFLIQVVPKHAKDLLGNRAGLVSIDDGALALLRVEGFVWSGIGERASMNLICWLCEDAFEAASAFLDARSGTVKEADGKGVDP